MNDFNFWKSISIQLFIGLLISLLFILFMPCEVKAEVFTPNITSIKFNHGNTFSSVNTVTPFGDFTSYQFSDISVLTPWSVEFGFTHQFPKNSQYFYVYGYSNISIDAAYTNSRSYCEIISGTSSDYPTNDSTQSNVQSLIPFGFKCKVIDKSDYYLNFLGNGIVSESITFAPRIFLKNLFFYDLDDSQSNIENYIQQDIEYSKEQIQKQEETNKAINDVNDTLSDGSVDSDAIGSIGSNLPGTNGVLSSILNLPVLFFSNLLNSLSTTSCPSLTFPIPFFDQECHIPCFRSILSDLGALSWFEGIGGLVGGLLIFNYIVHIGKTFNKMSDLDDTNNESWGGL